MDYFTAEEMLNDLIKPRRRKRLLQVQNTPPGLAWSMLQYVVKNCLTTKRGVAFLCEKFNQIPI